MIYGKTSSAATIYKYTKEQFFGLGFLDTKQQWRKRKVFLWTEMKGLSQRSTVINCNS